MTTAETYGGRLRAERERCGFSIEEATFRARGKLARPVSARTVGRLENGTTSEEAADEALVVALCQVYDVEPDTISVAITERAGRLRDLLIDRLRCSVEYPIAA